jgi:hypothetical protein
VDGWKFVKDTTDHLYPKERQMLDLIKESNVLTVEQLSSKMNYNYGKATEKAVEITAYRLKSKGLIEPVISHLEGLVSKEMRELSESSRAVNYWMRRLNSKQTQQKFLFLFLRYFQWIRANNHFRTPDEMIDHKQMAQNDKERYLHINLVEDYLEEAKLTVSQEKSTYVSIRSFYKHNKAALPPFNIRFRGKISKVSVPQQTISLEEVKQLLTNSNPREKGIFLSMLQSGMDRSTFCEVFNLQGWDQLAKQLGSENPDNWDLSRVPVRIDLIRPKTQNKYYSFLSLDALKAIQSWLRVRQTLTGKPMTVGEPLFLTSQRQKMKEDNVSGLFNRLAIASGLEIKRFGKPSEVRYRFHCHELRDTLKSTCTMAAVAGPVSEFILGHDIDKLGYDKSPLAYPEHYRAEYQKVEHFLNIFSNPVLNSKKLEEMEKKINSKDLEIEKLKKQNAELAVVVLDLNKKMDHVVEFMNEIEAQNPQAKRAIDDAYKKRKATKWEMIEKEQKQGSKKKT